MKTYRIMESGFCVEVFTASSDASARAYAAALMAGSIYSWYVQRKS